jgi:hypothetical protein
VSPATAALISICFTILGVIATMIYYSVKIGEYKKSIEEVDELKRTVQNHEGRLGYAEGQLERINGRH